MACMCGLVLLESGSHILFFSSCFFFRFIQKLFRGTVGIEEFPQSFGSVRGAALGHFDRAHLSWQLFE